MIWDEDIEAIADTLKENGITEFTISCQFSSLINTLVKFEKHGFRIVGSTEVNAIYTDFATGELAKIPALKLSCK